MSPIILTSFIIPAFTALVLIVLLIKERDNFLPKKQKSKRTERNNTTTVMQDIRSFNMHSHKKHPHDFLDLSGGSMGI